MSSRVSNTHETLVRYQTIRGSSDRSLGLVFALFFSVVGLLPLVRRHNVRAWALIAAAVFLAAALAFPSVLRPLNYVWVRLGLLLHAITSPIVLGILFYAVFTPFALILRMLGKDLLHLRFESAAGTYWLVRNPPGPTADSIRNQF